MFILVVVLAVNCLTNSVTKAMGWIQIPVAGYVWLDGRYIVIVSVWIKL